MLAERSDCCKEGWQVPRHQVWEECGGLNKVIEFGVRLWGGPPENGKDGSCKAAASDVSLADSPEDTGASISGATSDTDDLGLDTEGCPPSIICSATGYMGCLGTGVFAPKSGGASQECHNSSVAEGLCASNA